MDSVQSFMPSIVLSAASNGGAQSLVGSSGGAVTTVPVVQWREDVTQNVTKKMKGEVTNEDTINRNIDYTTQLPDELLIEIFIRLPPLRSCIRPASTVCRKWRSLISSPIIIEQQRVEYKR